MKAIPGTSVQAEPKSCFITELVDSFRFEDAKLPSLPSAVIYLEKAIRDDSVSLRQLADLLGKDPVLAARLIRVSNSAFYRSVSPVESVPEAVVRIGFAATRNIALVLLQNSFKARHELVGSMINQLWTESLQTAAVASALSQYYYLVDANRAMLGGLMYNVGAMLLLTKIDEKVNEISNPMIINLMLKQHSQMFGMKLLEHWEMDPDLLQVVANRDNWGRETENSPDLADLILVARCCIPGADGTEPDYDRCERLGSYSRLQTHMRRNQALSAVVQEAQETIEQTMALLGDD